MPHVTTIAVQSIPQIGKSSLFLAAKKQAVLGLSSVTVTVTAADLSTEADMHGVSPTFRM